MTETDPRIEAFFAKGHDWRDELLALRAFLCASALHEEFKWRSPTYTYEGANVATLWGFKDSAAVGFFKGVLLDDPKGLLEPPGPNSRSVRLMRFSASRQVAAHEADIKGFIDAAIALEKAGRKVDLPPDDLDLPEELAEALAADPELSAAWDALTPGRRRGYVVQIGQAKQSATRANRVEKHRDRILEGKGLHDR